RLVAPPAAPVGIIRVAVQPEHAGAHDLGPDLGEVRRRVGVIDTGRAFTGRLVKHARPEAAGGDVGVDQTRPVLPERVLGCLVRRRRKTVERDVQVDTHGHGLSLRSHCPLPSVSAAQTAWLGVTRGAFPRMTRSARATSASLYARAGLEGPGLHVE